MEMIGCSGDHACLAYSAQACIRILHGTNKMNKKIGGEQREP